MSRQITQEQTDKILQELLELNHITDPTELKTAIRTTLASLTKVERTALEMKLGQKTGEIDDGVKPRLVLKIIICFVISFGCSSLLSVFYPSIIWRILLYLLGFMSGMMAWIYVYDYLKSKKGISGNYGVRN